MTDKILKPGGIDNSLRMQATEKARAEGHFLGGWQAHELGWGARCMFCGAFVLVAHRIYGLAGLDCGGRR